MSFAQRQAIPKRLRAIGRMGRWLAGQWQAATRATGSCELASAQPSRASFVCMPDEGRCTPSTARYSRDAYWSHEHAAPLRVHTRTCARATTDICVRKSRAGRPPRPASKGLGAENPPRRRRPQNPASHRWPTAAAPTQHTADRATIKPPPVELNLHPPRARQLTLYRYRQYRACVLFLALHALGRAYA